MALRRCVLCHSLYDDRQSIRHNICPMCSMKLNGTYNRIHDYLKENGAQKIFNAHTLAQEIHADPAEVQMLKDLGWLERDIQTYGGLSSDRKELAERFESTLARMKSQRKANTYGGSIYARNL